VESWLGRKFFSSSYRLVNIDDFAHWLANRMKSKSICFSSGLPGHANSPNILL